MLGRLGLLWRKLTPYEAAVFRATAERLPATTATKLTNQVKRIWRVTRHMDWTEIWFHHRPSEFTEDSGIRFRQRDDVQVAQMRIEAGGTVFDSTLSSIHGLACALITRPSVREVAFKRPRAIEIVRIVDPDGAESEPARLRLPQSFLDWPTKGKKVNEWYVHRVNEVNVVHHSTADLAVLAERGEDECLLGAMDGSDAIYYSTDSDDLERIRLAFGEALRADLPSE